MIAALASAVGVLALLTIAPGPDMAVVARAAVRGGRRPAGQTASGVVAGLSIWGLLAVGGLAAVLAASAELYTAVKLAGAAYLIWLGVGMLWRGRGSGIEITARVGAVGREAGSPWRTGLATNLLNPKIGVFYTSVLPQLVPRGAPAAATEAGLVLAHAVLSLIWLNWWAAVVGRSGSVLGRRRVRRSLERISGAVLVGFGVEIAARGV